MPTISHERVILTRSIASYPLTRKVNLEKNFSDIPSIDSKKNKVRFSSNTFDETLSLSDMSEEEIRSYWYSSDELEEQIFESEIHAKRLSQRVRPALTILKAYRCIRKNCDEKRTARAKELLNAWTVATNGDLRGLEYSLDDVLSEIMISSQNYQRRKVLETQRHLIQSGQSSSEENYWELLRETSEAESKFAKEFALLLAIFDGMTTVQSADSNISKKPFKKEKLELKMLCWKGLKKNMFRKKVVSATSA